MAARAALLLIALVAGSAFAGCLVPDDKIPGVPAPQPPQRLEENRLVEGVPLQVSLAVGATSSLTLEKLIGVPVVVEFPKGIILVQDRRAVLQDQPTVHLEPGATVEFIVPPSREHIDVSILPATAAGLPSAAPKGVLAIDVPHVWGEGRLDAAQWYDLMRVVEAQFPYRFAGHANYVTYQTWAGAYLKGLGFRVEIDPYGTDRLNDVKYPHVFGGRQGAGSAPANVCGFKSGEAFPNDWIVFGGHYDIAETTVHGAYDDTAGVLTVLELARFFAPLRNDRTLVFCNWGGEEDGLVGSNVFASSLPPGVTIATYFNFDMGGLNWPGPHPKVVPLETLSLGAQKDRLQPVVERAQVEFLGYPAEAFRFASNVTGPSSDNLAFTSRGWSTVYPTSLGGGRYPWYHQLGDTLDNMTALMYAGPSGSRTADDLTPEELAEGKELMLRGFDLILWSSAYDAILIDQGALAITPQASARTG